MQEVEKQAPQTVFAEYKVLKEFTSGGSSAGTFLVADGVGKLQVLKFSTWQGIGGSGKPWLKAQASRLIELKNSLPEEGRNAIPVVYKTYEDDEVYYYTLEYFDGLPFSTLHYLDKDFNLEKMTIGIERILDLMTNNFYDQGRLDTPSDYVYTTHIRRAQNRLALLTNSNSEVFRLFIEGKPFIIGDAHFDNISTLFELILNAPIIAINEQQYPNPMNVLRSLGEEEIASLTPSFIPLYSHGDGTLRNYLVLPDGEIKVIDVRGVELPGNIVTRIDVSYELGKMMRTVFLEIVRNNDFTVALNIKDGELKFTINFNKDSNAINFANSRIDILRTFRKHSGLNRILHEEENWVEKILFAEALHFLADSANRLESDRMGKQTLVYFLLGTMLLSSYKNH